ncbi:MAG: hypothetical protein J5J04_02005, partial [Anaerolineae bacterium]|nr:hypothetical protein [Anaerolineae bacterium]
MKTGTQVYYTRSEVPPTTTQSVTASMLLKSYVSGSNVGVSARHSAPRTFIGAVLSTDGAGGYKVRLVKVSGGTFSSDPIEQPVTLSVGVPALLTLEVDGVSPAVNCTVKLDGVTVITATVTENDFDTKGSVGLLYYFGSSVTSTTGLHAASFYASDTLGGAPANPPQGTVTIGTITPGTTSASVAYSYNDTDQTGFEYRLDGGAAASIGASPATISGLTASTEYDIEIRAINGSGAGAWSSVATFTTGPAGDTENPTLTGSVTFASITQTTYTAQWPAGSDNVAVTGYEYQIGSTAGAWTDAGNNLSAAITGRTAGTTETVYVRAYDAAGLRSTPAISGEVTLESIPAAGINVTDPLKNNTGTVLASQSGVRVAVLQAADLVSVFETSGLTTNASGILATISDAA